MPLAKFSVKSIAASTSGAADEICPHAIPPTSEKARFCHVPGDTFLTTFCHVPDRAWASRCDVNTYLFYTCNMYGYNAIGDATCRHWANRHRGPRSNSLVHTNTTHNPYACRRQCHGYQADCARHIRRRLLQGEELCEHQEASTAGLDGASAPLLKRSTSSVFVTVSMEALCSATARPSSRMGVCPCLPPWASHR